MRVLIRAAGCLFVWATIAPTHAQNLSTGQAPPDYKGQKFEILGDTGPASAAVSIASTTGFRSLTTVPMYPVLYCGGGAAGPNEYPIEAGAAQVRWLLEVPSPPAGAKMYDARYEAYDNIIAINSFAKMLVEKVDDNHVSITAQAYSNCNGARVRLRITVSYAQ